MEPAVRLTFEIADRGSLRLVESSSLQKRFASAGVVRLFEEPLSGFWIELRNSLDEPVYRQGMDDPTLRFEGPLLADDRDQPEYQSGLISIVVPDVANATRLVIMASRPPDAPASPILDLDLKSRA